MTNVVKLYSDDHDVFVSDEQMMIRDLKNQLYHAYDQLAALEQKTYIRETKKEIRELDHQIACLQGQNYRYQEKLAKLRRELSLFKQMREYFKITGKK